MPCPHYKITIISRGKGHSAVAAAAYQSGERLYSNRDYRTKKYRKDAGEVVYSEVMLPPNAPPEYADRNILWNAVEEAEPNWNSQLARRLVITLPAELSMEDNIALVTEYCRKEFLEKGMIVDLCVHDPVPPGHNPHAHVMLTMRALDENGHWMEKAHKEYVLDENGERIRTAKGNWKTKKVPTTDWDERSNAEKWRHEWEALQNRYLEKANRPERVSMKSYKRQNVEQIPTVHMGPAVTAMERKGIYTDIGNLNREIRETNKVMNAIRRAIASLMSWLEEVKAAIAEIEAAPKEVYLADLLIQRFEERENQRRDWESGKGKQNAAVMDLQRFADITAYLKEHRILTVADLEKHMDEIQAAANPLKKRVRKAESRISQIGKIRENVERYNALNPIHEQYQKIHWKGRKQKFAEEHKEELAEWNKVNRYLRKNLPEWVYRPKALAAEEETLNAELEELKAQIVPLDSEIRMMKDVRYYVKDLLPELVPEEEPLTPERKEEKRKSVRERLANAQDRVDARNETRRSSQQKTNHLSGKVF